MTDEIDDSEEAHDQCEGQFGNGFFLCELIGTQECESCPFREFVGRAANDIDVSKHF